MPLLSCHGSLLTYSGQAYFGLPGGGGGDGDLRDGNPILTVHAERNQKVERNPSNVGLRSSRPDRKNRLDRLVGGFPG